MNRYRRLRELMERREVDAVVLRRPANFAWYTGGADSKVDHVASEGVADLIVRPHSELVLTSTIEAPRMRAEQTPELEVVEYPWHLDRDAALRELVGDARVGSDLGLTGTIDLSDDIARIRRTLDADAIESLRAVGGVSCGVGLWRGAVAPRRDGRDLLRREREREAGHADDDHGSSRALAARAPRWRPLGHGSSCVARLLVRPVDSS